MEITGAEVDKNALSRIAETYGIELMVLFGSQAKGASNRQSDTDVAVRTKVPVSKEELLEIAREIDHLLPQVDLCDLRRASPLLLGAIAKDGRVLFESTPSTFANFRIRAINEYLDYQPYLERLGEKNKELLEALS